MNRRAYLAAVGTAGVVSTAGCSALRGETTLSDPTVKAESSGRRSLIFAANDEEVGHLGVDGSVESDLLELRTEIWHRNGTEVESITLRVWMPPAGTDATADVAVVGQVEGDSSPPPSVSLYAPARSVGTAIEIDDLDDLADETISTLDLLVRPGSETATTLAIDATIALASGGVLGSDYVLDGRLRLEFPELAHQ